VVTAFGGQDKANAMSTRRVVPCKRMRCTAYCYLVAKMLSLGRRSSQRAVIRVIRSVIRCKKWVIRVIRRFRKESLI
jgi:hypothetical protein